MDTDNDILEGAIQNCKFDLRLAIRRLTKAEDDGNLNLPMLRNYKLKVRTERPQMFDRNGILKEEI